MSPPTLHAIYVEHARYVWRVLRRLGVAEEEAADATQDVFLVIHQRLGEFEGRARLTTWLFRICLNVARDRRRSSRRRPETPDAALVEAAPATGPDAEVHLHRRQGIEQFDRLLDELDLDQRAVFVLFELEEMSGDDIAETLQIPVGTVRSRLRLAREAFRAAAARWQARDRFFTPVLGGRT